MMGPDIEPPEKVGPPEYCGCGKAADYHEPDDECIECREKRQALFARQNLRVLHDFIKCYRTDVDSVARSVIHNIELLFEIISDEQKRFVGEVIYEKFKAWLPDSPGKKGA